MSTSPATLSPVERKALKARAHSLEPVVLIGDKGLTDALIAEVDRALTAHELIKVRAPGLEREERALAMEHLCARCGAQAVQLIGKVLVMYRETPPEDKPAAAPRPPSGARGTGSAKRSGRRESRSVSGRPESAPQPSRRRTSR